MGWQITEFERPCLEEQIPVIFKRSFQYRQHRLHEGLLVGYAKRLVNHGYQGNHISHDAH
jgi:hypothetical protein